MQSLTCFQLDVSFLYRNKSGYAANGALFNRSFQTISLTPASLLIEVIQQGWPYTAVHTKREPSATGADARGVKTPKHIENFVSSQVLTGDDDSGSAETIAHWLAAPFFSRYGWAFVESASSTPTAQRGHPILLFDKPITSLNLWRDCLRAFVHAYPHLDSAIKNPVATYYNQQGAKVYLVNGGNNICPFSVYEHCILLPYYEWLAATQIVTGSETEQIQLSTSRMPDDLHDRYLLKAVDSLLFEVASAENGSRHITLRNKSKRIGHLLAGNWHSVVMTDIEDRLLCAAERCHYVQEHGIGVTRSTIVSGLYLGRQQPAPLPDCLRTL